jgi:hypothetical protein
LVTIAPGDKTGGTMKRPLPEVPASKPYLSVRESAGFLGCSPSKIKKMRAEGTLPNQQEWTREELLAAAKKRATQPPKPRGKGLKLDLGNPVKKSSTKNESEGGEPPAAPRVATQRPAAPSTPPRPSNPPKREGGLLAALDLFDEDDEENDA